MDASEQARPLSSVDVGQTVIGATVAGQQGRLAARRLRYNSSTMPKLQDKSAVITGATRGFGYEIAKAFLSEGARVMICGRSHESTGIALERLRTELGPGISDRLTGMACDTSDPDQVAKLAERAVHNFGIIDVWVNNAALSGPYGEIETIPREDVEELVRTNILGYYYGTLAALEHMLPRRGGKIINIAGLGADGRPAPFQAAYSSTKAWVASFTRSVAGEHKDSGVGVFVLNPGMMTTDMLTQVCVTSDAARERIERLPTVLRVLGQHPEVPARRAVRLASSATDGRTGLVVKVLTPWKLAALLAADLGRRVTGKKKSVPDIKITRAGPSRCDEEDGS